MSRPAAAGATSMDKPTDADSAAAPAVPAAMVDTAINWLIKLDFGEAGPVARQAFERWRNAHPLHALAWQRVSALGDDFIRMPPRLALDALQAGDTLRATHRIERRQAIKLLAALGILAGGSWLVRDTAPWQRVLADAATAVGEQRRITLADGTELTLNTDTAVDIDLGGNRRMVALRRGEIMISTGNDAQATHKRPFWVQTPFGAMQALGTRFVVRLDPQHARVKVQEGAVRVHPAGHGQPEVVQAGQSWQFDRESGVVAPDIGFDPDGWVDGVIAGQNMRLQDLLDELNRYRSGRIVCDERVAALRVSGVYQVRDTDNVLRFLAQHPALQISYLTRFWVTVGPRPPA